MKLNCYLKVTNLCNLNCLHCYNASSYVLKTPERIPESHLLKFFQILTPWLEDKENRLLLIFHGGEPLYFGSDFIYDICKKAETIFGSFFDRVEFHIQTNLTFNISDDFVKLLNAFFEKKVGTSFDPFIRRLGNSYEKFRNLWERNVKFLIDQGIYVSVSVVLTKYFFNDFNLWIETVNYLRSLGIQSIHIERFTPTGRGSVNREDLYLNDREFFKLMNDILDFYLFLLSKGELFYINPLESMLKYSALGTGVSCWSGNCVFDTLTLEPDGEIYGCPELKARGISPLGNISEVKSVEDILFNRNRLKRFVRLNTDFKDHCKYYHLCHRGCPSSPHNCAEAYEQCQVFFRKVVEAGVLYSKLFTDFS